jgi:hypothetical protein
MMRNVIVIASIIFALGTPSLRAAESFDGLWAKTAKECRNKEGPDSKTFIDLSKPIGGEPAPMVDQYENHCRIERKTAAGDGMNLTVTCFEFWDDFKKEVDGRKATIKLSPGSNGALKIDDRPYLRCKTENGRSSSERR